MLEGMKLGGKVLLGFSVIAERLREAGIEPENTIPRGDADARINTNSCRKGFSISNLRVPAPPRRRVITSSHFNFGVSIELGVRHAKHDATLSEKMDFLYRVFFTKLKRMALGYTAVGAVR
jgi:hypothetical protein